MESEPLNKFAEIDAAHPVIEPGHTFASVTDKISAIVLTQRTPRFWYVGFGLSFILV
jgi:molybdopterin-containing oxidoreductase family membrane subunit